MSGPVGVSGGDPAVEPPRQRSLSTRNVVVLVAAVVLIVAIAALNLIHVPVAILRPGPVTNTLGKFDGKPVIEVQGARSYPTSGSLDFTTVSMAGGPQYPVSVMQWIRAKFDDHAQIDPEDRWFPKGITSQQVQQQNTAEMTNSQQTAEVVAMRAAGVKVPETITVAQLQPGAAAQGALKQGDTLVRVNGVSVQNLQNVADAMAKAKAGSKVAVTVSRGGKQQELQVPTAAGPEGKAVFGIAISPNYKFPYQVKVNAGDVGGPSAGTMFTLAIYDLITPGPLTGGRKIAGTGTMAEDGSVGPIGGIAQKMQGAKEAGAQFFLAPVSDCSDARGNIPKGLTVVKVATFNDALTAVKQIGTGKTSGFPSC